VLVLERVDVIVTQVTLRTAKALRLAIPRSMLLRADTLIQ
jgi:hypothetical protein